MVDAPGEYASEFCYFFSVPEGSVPPPPPAGAPAPAVPFLPSTQEHPTVYMSIAGYFRMFVAPDRPPATFEEGDRAAKPTHHALVTAGSTKSGGSSSRLVVLRIGGPLPTEEKWPSITLPDGTVPEPSSLVGVRGTGHNAGLKKRFQFYGAFHPPTGTCHVTKAFDGAKPPSESGGRRESSSSASSASKVPRAANGLSTDAITHAQRERRQSQGARAPPPADLLAAAGGRTTAAGNPKLPGEQGALQEIVEALQRDTMAGAFLQPVDAVKLNIPDYYDIVKNVRGGGGWGVVVGVRA
jgi:hypothetical protein